MPGERERMLLLELRDQPLLELSMEDINGRLRKAGSFPVLVCLICHGAAKTSPHRFPESPRESAFRAWAANVKAAASVVGGKIKPHRAARKWR